ncbi:unnamed protein product, partial [Sphagnum jensenii]
MEKLEIWKRKAAERSSVVHDDDDGDDDDDDSGLELCLGLSLGGSKSNSKGSNNKSNSNKEKEKFVEQSSAGVRSLLRAGSLGSGAFNRLGTPPSANPVPPAPQSVLSRTKSDAVPDRLLRREASTGSAFASVQGSLPSLDGLAGEEASSLRPGFAAGQHFGGTGSPPDLPWVTCNGTGPSGKTISGVLYRVEKGQVKIVCACHGRHMSPAEFVQHAGGGEMSNPEKAIVVGPFTIPTQTAAS